MSPEELEQIQHVIQASHSIQWTYEAKPLLETIDTRLYSQIFKVALSDLYELQKQQPQASARMGIMYLVQYLDSCAPAYTAEDIRSILQLINDLLTFISDGDLFIFPLPCSFEPYLMRPEVFALCQTAIVTCYWAAYRWSKRWITPADQYRQILLIGDALLGDDQPGVPGLLRRYAKGSNLPLEEQSQEFLSVYYQEFNGRSWLFKNHDLGEQMRQTMSAPLKVRLIRDALAEVLSRAQQHHYDLPYSGLINTLSSDPLPGTIEDILDVLQHVRTFWQLDNFSSTDAYKEISFYALLTAFSPCLLLPETLEPCRGEVEALYHHVSNTGWYAPESLENRIRLLLRQILFPESAGPLMDCLQASDTHFATDHDAQTLLQAYHQEYANSINNLDPSFTRLFKQKFTPQFTIRLIRQTAQEIQIKMPDDSRPARASIHQSHLLITTLCKKVLPFTPDDIHAILDAMKGFSDIDIHLFLMKTLAPHMARPEVLERCRVDLEELQTLAPSVLWDKRTCRTYLLLIADILSTRQQTISYPLLPDAWATPIIDELMALGEAERVAWSTLLHHCAKAKEKTPPAPWLEQASSLIEAIGSDPFTRTVHRWISLFSDKKGERMDDTNSNILRGLIWLCIGSEDRSLATILADAAIEGYRKLPGLGPRSPKVGTAAVTTLVRMPGMYAIGQLERVRLNVKQPTYQKGIEQALDEVALRENMSRADLEELTVPTFDLQNGQAQFSFGSWSAHLTTSGRNVHLHWFDQDGKALKSVPAMVKNMYKEEYKDLTRRVDDIEHLLKTQRMRFERFYLVERHWPLAVWQERYLHHPLLNVLSHCLIWQLRIGAQSQQVIWHEGQLVDVNNQPLELPTETEVSLWHPLMSSAQEVQRWRLWLEEHLITQPFKQAHREVYPLTDAERATGDASRRFAGHFIRQHQLNALAPLRGWTFSLQHNFSGALHEVPAHLALPHLGIRAEWVVNVDLDGDGEIPRYVRTSWVRFSLMSDSYLMPLEQVPSIIFSEVMRDVDLFVSASSVGADPYGNNETGEIGLYWHTYNQSALSLSAMERKNALERLVSRLAIAGRCTFEGSFLIVRGDLCTYHIHLGSGNILMEPGNRYLCIVSDPDQTVQMTDEGQFFLPFEGDVLLSLILSKALLLAEDSQIKDPSIRSQILS